VPSAQNHFLVEDTVKKTALTCLLTVVCLCAGTLLGAESFTVCKGRYALCTTATCTAIPGQADTVSCACEVKTGYSAGKEACHEVKKTPPGQLMSRYFPIKYHAICSNDRPWANCLDKPCTVDKNNPSKTTCACSLVRDQGNYVIVTDTYNDSICTTGVRSSATVQQAAQITDFLKTTDQIKPFPIKIVNSPK
jgi:hypothetical protein